MFMHICDITLTYSYVYRKDNPVIENPMKNTLAKKE